MKDSQKEYNGNIIIIVIPKYCNLCDLILQYFHHLRTL